MKKANLLFCAFKEVYQHGRGFFWIYLLKNFIVTSKIYLTAWLSKILFNEILRGITLGQITSELLVLTLYVVFAEILFAFINLFLEYFSEISLMKYSNVFTMKNTQKCSRLKYALHDNPSDKNEVKQFISDSKSVIGIYRQTIGLIFTSVSLVISFCISIKFSVAITILSLMASIPSFFIRSENKNADYQLEKELNFTDRVIEYFKEVCTGKVFYKEIHVLSVVSFFFENLKESLNQKTKKGIEFRRRKLFREIILILVFAIVNIVINVCVIVFVVIKKLTIGDYTYYTTIINNLKNDADSTVTHFSDFWLSFKRLEKYYLFYNNTDNEYVYGEIPMPNEIKTISFSHVYFKYPNAQNYALKDVSFKVSTSEKIALAGSNGAGKSTIINLLLRFYEPTHGHIFINDRDIQCYNLQDYWMFFSCMFQNSNLYNITLKENLLLGSSNSNGCISNQSLLRILSSMGTDVKLEDLNRSISKQFDKEGLIFSPGQSQKINVARTLLSNRPIVILDEPSSSMDAATEDRVLRTVFSFSKNKILFFISHRLSNMKKVDKILFLEKGKIEEIGRHEDLINNKGKYYTLFTKQADKYL